MKSKRIIDYYERQYQLWLFDINEDLDPFGIMHHDLPSLIRMISDPKSMANLVVSSLTRPPYQVRRNELLKKLIKDSRQVKENIK